MSESINIRTYRMYLKSDRDKYDKDYYYYTCINTTYQNTDSSGVAKILAQFKYSPSCYLLYHEITVSRIKDMILNDKPIDLTGKYIKNFNFKHLQLEESYQFNDFNASYTYWDGSTSFAFSRYNDEDINFYRANFSTGNLSFYRANFGKGNINFNNTNFDKGNVNFAYSNFIDGKISYNGANFGEGKINFTKVNFGSCKISFSYTHFGGGEITFNSSTANKISFEAIKFRSDIDLQFKYVNKLFFNSCINKDHMQISGIKHQLSFKKSTNLGRIKLDWQKSNVEKAIENAYPITKYMDGSEKKDTYSLIADDFLMLKENYSKEGKYDYEDAAYRAYMKYNTKSMKLLSSNFSKKTFNLVFGAISGYGTKAGNILIFCILTIITFGFIYYSTFFNSLNIARSLLKSMYFSTITFLTIGYGDLSPLNTDFTDLQTLCTGIEGFVGLLLMSMVTVVIMRKVLR